MKLIDNSSKTNWKYIAIVVVLGLVVGGGSLLYVNSPQKESESGRQPIQSNSEQNSYPQIFRTQEECEKTTKRKCTFAMCDLIPEGKTFQEVCGGISKGWISTEETLEIDTSGWQTYRNDEFGFEIKYPLTLYVKEKTKQIFLVKKNATQAEQIDLSDNLVDIRVNTATYRFESYYNTSDNTVVTNYGDIKTRNRIVDNYKAVDYKTQLVNVPAHPGVSMEKPVSRAGTIVNRNGTIIEISTDAYFGEFKYTFDQILSTFRFVE